MTRYSCVKFPAVDWNCRAHGVVVPEPVTIRNRGRKSWRPYGVRPFGECSALRAAPLAFCQRLNICW